MKELIHWIMFLLSVAFPIQSSWAVCSDIPCTLSNQVQRLHRARLKKDLVHLRILIREGDSIWSINHRLGISFRKRNKGKVADVTALNPDVIFMEGGRVSYSQMILLPITELPLSSDYEVNDQTKVITFKEHISESKVEFNSKIDTIVPVVPAENIQKNETLVPKDLSFFKHVFKVGGGLNFTQISAEDPINGGKASLSSKLNYDLGLGYRIHFSSTFNIGAAIDFNFVNYQTVSTRTILGNQPIFMNARLESAYRFFQNLQFTSRFSYAQRPFIRGLSSSILQLDTIGTLGLGGGLGWMFLETGKFQFSVDAGGGYLFSSKAANYTIKAGNFYAFSTRCGYLLNPKQFVELIPYWRADQQDTDNLVDGTSEYGIKINYGFSY